MLADNRNQTGQKTEGGHQSVPGKTCVGINELLEMEQGVPRLLRVIDEMGIGQQSGNRSVDKAGQGMSYVETRPWVTGDDVRQMNWRVMARTQQPHTKVFDQERNETWWLLVDTRLSMAFGTRRRFKRVQAARTAALLAATGRTLGHSIAMILLNDDGPVVLSPGVSREQYISQLQHLSQACAQTTATTGDRSGTPSSAVTQLNGLFHNDSTLIVLSDFLGLSDDFYDGLKRLAVLHCVRAVRIVDAVQTKRLPAGHYPLHDGERRIRLTIRNQTDADAFLDAMKTQITPVDSYFRRHGIGLCTLDTAAELSELVSVVGRGLSRHR